MSVIDERVDGAIYAQVIKENMRVNLIGGVSKGLYLFDLPLAFTVDITDRYSEVGLGYLYDAETNSFIDDGEDFILTPQQSYQEQVTDETFLVLQNFYDAIEKGAIT